MTTEEFREILSDLSEEERTRFVMHIGLPKDRTNEEFVLNFMVSAAFQERTCDYFKVPSQAAKIGQASLESARYARLAYYASIVGIVIGIVAFVVSLIR